MSGERWEHGPDFMCSVSRDDIVALKLVDLLVQKGYAISLADQDQRFLTLNASPKARDMLNSIMMSSEFIATQGAFRGSIRGSVGKNAREVVEECEWPYATKQSVLATYAYNSEIVHGRGEANALRLARRESVKRVDADEVPKLLTPCVVRAEVEIVAKGITR